jgi:paraquat-inducible protein B
MAGGWQWMGANGMFSSEKSEDPFLSDINVLKENAEFITSYELDSDSDKPFVSVLFDKENAKKFAENLAKDATYDIDKEISGIKKRIDENKKWLNSYNKTATDALKNDDYYYSAGLTVLAMQENMELNKRKDSITVLTKAKNDINSAFKKEDRKK